MLQVRLYYRGCPKSIVPNVKASSAAAVNGGDSVLQNDIVYRLIRGSRWKNPKIPIFQSITDFGNPSFSIPLSNMHSDT